MVLTYSQTLPQGWQIPDFSLPSTEGKNVSPSDFSHKRGLLVIITCNHCPYAQAAWPLLTELYEKYKEQVAFLAINPNDASAYPEDSFEEMKKQVVKRQIKFPYLRDESQEVAKAFQAQCTPDLYLFENKEGSFQLFYHGRINDNWQNPDQVKERNLEDALSRLVAGQEPPAQQPPSMGCSIKWKQGKN